MKHVIATSIKLHYCNKKISNAILTQWIIRHNDEQENVIIT